MAANDDDKQTADNVPSDEPPEDNPQGLAGVPSIVAEFVVAALAGIPPQVQRSFYKAVDHVFRAGAQWPATYFKGKSAVTEARSKVEVARIEATAADLKAAQRAKDLITRESAKAAASLFSDQSRAERAFNYHTASILRDQEINEDIVRIAAEEIRNNPPKSDSNVEVDSDWLSGFFKEAPTRSTDEFRHYFGRILAGEITKPGTFSISAVRIFATLSSDTANIFQSLCNVSTFLFGLHKVISDPFGQAGDNALSNFGLTYDQLTKLVEVGLLRSAFEEYQDVPYVIVEERLAFAHAETQLFFLQKTPSDGAINKESIRFTGPTFTAVGSELRQIVSMHHSPEYLAGLARWIDTRNLVLCIATHSSDGKVWGRKIDPA